MKNNLWGIRNLEAVSDEVKKMVFLENIFRMTVNNFSIIFKKVSC